MQEIKIITILGARPQFIKAAAVSRAFTELNKSQTAFRVTEVIVHTGQHYDSNMSKVFFDELAIPLPSINLGVGSGLHGAQTASMLEGLEHLLLQEHPHWVLIYGDTNSTLAGALAAAKLNLPVAHVEAGLRSFNRRMPEEINRVVADHLSNLLFCPTHTAVANLKAEGITRGVVNTGDVMYDSLVFNTALADHRSTILGRLGVRPGSYYLATVHRAENTDDPGRLDSILAAFRQVRATIVMPLHPRTRRALGARLAEIGENVRVIEPVSYLDMLQLERNARLVLTDSGGVQKEAYWFGRPCITLRDETEWTELVESGWNVLAGADVERILVALEDAERRDATGPTNTDGYLYGDGTSATKIARFLIAPDVLRVDEL